MNKSAQIHILVLLGLILVGSIFFITAENITNGENVTEQIDLCNDVICNNIEIKCSDGIIVECSTECNVETGECGECVPDCDSHEEISESVQPSEQNVSINETIEDAALSINETETVEELPSLNVILEYPKKITRGEEFEIKATISNEQIIAKNVAANWIAPKGFEIISEEKECGDLINGETCILKISLQTSLKTEIGLNEIKIEVSYE